jgi:short-subunit dehydrogenase
MSRLIAALDRTGAPAQRGAIVNVSSLFAMVSHPTSGGVSISP